MLFLVHLCHCVSRVYNGFYYFAQLLGWLSLITLMIRSVTDHLSMAEHLSVTEQLFVMEPLVAAAGHVRRRKCTRLATLRCSCVTYEELPLPADP